MYFFKQGMIYKPFNSAIKLYLNHRFKRIEAIRNKGAQLQQNCRNEIWDKIKNTKYVEDYGVNKLEDLPVVEYNDVKSFIERMVEGDKNVLCPGRVDWYSKSSGTTNDRSKYIPVPDALFYNNMISSSWDTTSIIYNRWKEANLFGGKSLIMGGSLSPIGTRPEVKAGDVSAILIKRIPAIGKPFYTPSPDIATLTSWDEKIAKIIETTLDENVVMFGGVPTWNIVLFDKILDFTGKNNILEVWPNLNVYIHGGVAFEPYKEKFKEYLPKPDFKYVEVYNSSEGYYAVQDRDDEGMLLLLDNSIYYEFIPFDKMDDPYNHIVPIEGVEKGKIYTMVISTSGGLIRYILGDTVQFLSTNPYRIKVAGRTAQYINTFGEEVMVSNTDKALALTCSEMNVKVSDYTVAPRYFDQNNKAGHEWLIEFEENSYPIEKFEASLDENLRKINSDYDAKRYNDMALKRLNVVSLPQGTFHRWLASKGKIGGQNKVPRLSNDRKYLDAILKFVNH